MLHPFFTTIPFRLPRVVARLPIAVIALMTLVGACGNNNEPAGFAISGVELPLTVEEIDEMVVYVSAQSGREWKQPPTIVVQNATEYAAGLQLDADEQAQRDANIAITARRLQALGLSATPRAQLQTMVEDFAGSSIGIVAYYDPPSDEIRLPASTQSLNALRGTLVHELGHALDGQYVDLQGFLDERSANPWRDNSGSSAIIEGRASALEAQWRLDTNQPADPPPAETPDLPLPMLLSVAMPYVRGAVFIEAQGGIAETWELFDELPASSEQYMYADRYPDDQPVAVPAPTADGPVLAELEWGALDLYTWLASVESPDNNPAAVADTASDGLAGGSGVLWGGETESCLRLALEADTPEDGMEIFAAIESWASQDAGRTVDIMEDQLIVTGCAPYLD